MIQKFGEFGFNGKTLEELYKSKLEEISSKMQYEGQDSRKIEIIVFELDGVTLRTEIKMEDKDYIMDLDTTSGKTISIKQEKLTGEGSDIKLFELGKINNDNMITRTVKYSDTNQMLEMNMNAIKQENQITVNANANYSNEYIASLGLEAKEDFILTSNQELPEKFDETNNILLNDYEGDKISSIFDDLKDRTIKKLEEKQSKINTKLLNNILVWIDTEEKQKEEEEKNNDQVQKERFNNKFILYEGTDLEYEDIKNLINVVSQNMSDYKIISGNEIQILIEEGTQNTEKAQKILKNLTDEYTYNVVIKYSEDGYVNAINISVYEEE